MFFSHLAVLISHIEQLYYTKCEITNFYKVLGSRATEADTNGCKLEPRSTF